MGDLDALLEDYPSTSQLSRSVTGVWPGRQTYLARYVNVPIDTPSPDPIYLIEHPDAGLALIEAAGFEIVSQELYATQGRPIEKALLDRISISMAIVGRKN